MAINYQEYVAGLVARARAAQKIAETYDQERVDELCAAIAYCATRPQFMKKAAEMCVEETGMGDPIDKQAKIWNKTIGHYREMKDEKSVGLIEFNPVTNVAKYAKPMGVIGALAPVTNAENTAVVKPMNAIKGRNAMIVAPHPRASRTNQFIINYLRSILKKYNAPEDLVIAIEPEYVSIECSAELMKQVDFVLATGGTPMVRQAYKSGTPTIGVGTGNSTTFVDGTTDLNKVAEMIRISKTFDNATSCSTENNILVLENIYDEFVEALKKNGGYYIPQKSEEHQALKKALWPEWPANHKLNRHIVAQPISKIAEIAGINVPEGTEFLFTEENEGIGEQYPFTGEKLSRVTALIKVKSFEEALDKMEAILEYMGKGHSCGIHTTDENRIDAMAKRMPVARMMVNQPQSVGNSGSWENGMPMTMTLGCGTWGGNSVSHNVNWKDLINFTHVSKPLPFNKPTEEELFSKEFMEANAEFK